MKIKIVDYIVVKKPKRPRRNGEAVAPKVSFQKPENLSEFYEL